MLRTAVGCYFLNRNMNRFVNFYLIDKMQIETTRKCFEWGRKILVRIVLKNSCVNLK